jgi:hypothetical protein
MHRALWDIKEVKMKLVKCLGLILIASAVNSPTAFAKCADPYSLICDFEDNCTCGEIKPPETVWVYVEPLPFNSNHDDHHGVILSMEGARYYSALCTVDVQAFAEDGKTLNYSFMQAVPASGRSRATHELVDYPSNMKPLDDTFLLLSSKCSRIKGSFKLSNDN